MCQAKKEKERINKPIGDFIAETFLNDATNSDPDFTATSDGSVQVVGNSAIIPEPEEYAFVFGLLALAFVIICRRIQKKRR